MNIEKSVKVDASVIEMIEGIYEDYAAKKDLIASMFEIHKSDEDDSFVESKPFLAYEKKFQKVKVAYDTAMTEIRDKYVPKEYQTGNYKFEVNFENNSIDISRM